MPKRKTYLVQKPALMLQVWTELGAGRITEKFIHDDCEFVDGLTVGSYITINPVHQTCDTVIHEILHRLHPEWDENYVRNRTSYLRNRMTDSEIKAFYDEYQKRKR